MTTATPDLPSESWAEYFDALSRELLRAPTSIEVGDPSGPASVEARHVALHALTYDRRNDVFEVAVARSGPHPPGVLLHHVDHPARVAVDDRTMLAPMTIAVDGRDGLRTMIRIEQDPDTPARERERGCDVQGSNDHDARGESVAVSAGALAGAGSLAPRPSSGRGSWESRAWSAARVSNSI